MSLAPRPDRCPPFSRRHAASVAVVLGVVCGLLGGGCGEGGRSLSDLEEFDAYALYYAGEEVAGNELEEIAGGEDWRSNPDQRSVGFTFFYGTCDTSPDGFFDEGGCAPPVQIQVSSICDRYPARFKGKQEVFDLRGAKASPSGGGLEILTGRTTLVIFASDARLTKATVRLLRRVGEPAPPPRLPAPPPGAVEGRLPCQR